MHCLKILRVTNAAAVETLKDTTKIVFKKVCYNGLLPCCRRNVKIQPAQYFNTSSTDQHRSTTTSDMDHVLSKL